MLSSSFKSLLSSSFTKNEEGLSSFLGDKSEDKSCFVWIGADFENATSFEKCEAMIERIISSFKFSLIDTPNFKSSWLPLFWIILSTVSWHS